MYAVRSLQVARDATEIIYLTIISDFFDKGTVKVLQTSQVYYSTLK